MLFATLFVAFKLSPMNLTSPCNSTLQHDAAISRDQLDVNLQFGCSNYCRRCASRFAAWIVLFDECLQDEHPGNIGIPISLRNTCLNSFDLDNFCRRLS